MLNGRILPWVQDDSSDDYPVWSEYEANQRDVFFINNEGFIDTSFSITPYSPSSIEDVQYIKNIILEIKNASLSIDDKLKPESFTLRSNYPNPFNPYTNIRIDLAKQDNVDIIIFDVLGREIFNKKIENLKTLGAKTNKQLPQNILERSQLDEDN